MPSFTSSASARVDPLDVLVFVSGVRRSDVFCRSVSYGLGASGSTASFELPAAYWDDPKAALRGAPVQVLAGYRGGYLSAVFSGYLMTTSASAAGQTVAVEAVSTLGLAAAVYLGQDSVSSLVVEYPSRALRDGELVETGWTIRDVLRDIFNASPRTWRGGGGSLPSQWRSQLGLGSLSVLSAAWATFPLGDLVFRQATLADALQKLLGLAGSISCRERFNVGGSTTLEFFELGAPWSPSSTVKIARRGEPALGSNVLTIDQTEGAEDVKTRLIGLGAPRRYIVSTSTAHATAPLVPLWNPALEAAVLANPEGTKRGNETVGDASRPEFSEDRALVFRLFKLPDEFRRRALASDLPIEYNDGRKLPLAAWKFGQILDNVGGAWTSTPSAVPTLLEGAQFDLENGTVTLKKPAINLVDIAVDLAGEQVDTYAAAVVGVTLCVEGDPLRHDTGVSRAGFDFGAIAAAGITEVVVNDSFEFVQLTNGGADFDGSEFDAWVNFPGVGWAFYSAGAPATTRDDADVLREFTEAALLEKLRVRTTYSVTTPFFQPGYRLGARVRIVGQNDFDFGTHQIRSLSHVLTSDHSTSFATDSGVPLTFNEILGGSAE